MKKALSVFLMLALVGSVFAAEPVADVNIAEFTGDASVQWGINLDTNKTGFQNSANVTLKLNLLNEGSKSTTGDGVWGELVIKTDGDTFAKATNTSNITLPEMKVVVDTAKIHFGPAYIGITSGNTQTGELKMDAAVRSADSNYAVKIGDVGPADFSQGITLGYDHDMFNIAADVRSHNKLFEVWKINTDGAPTDMQTLDSVKYAGVTTPVNEYLFGSQAEADRVADLLKKSYTNSMDKASVKVVKAGEYNPDGNQYTNAYAFALEGEVKPVENLSIKAGVSYNYDVDKVPMYQVKDDGTTGTDIEVVENPVVSTLGYSASVGYKLALGDTFYLRPQVGFTGSHNLSNKNDKGAYNVAGGLLFGWGDIGVDANPDVYYMDTDDYKKVSPGVGVVVYAGDVQNSNGTITITPSFFSGEIIPGLTAATYGNITVGTGDNTEFGYNMASSAKYDIPVGAGTITPKAGVYLEGGKEELTKFTTKVGVDVAGFVSNTTFFTVYDSGNLLMDGKGTAKDSKLGTLNFGAKISF